MAGAAAFDGFIDGLKAESDRAAAVLGAAFLDMLLENALRKRLVADVDKTAFESNGPFGSFSNRTTVAYSLGWIDRNTKADLDLIRRIRNEFAHDANQKLSFESPAIKSRAQQLQVLVAMEKVIADVGKTLPDSNEAKAAVKATLDNCAPSRRRFEFCIMILAAAIAEAALQGSVDVTAAQSAPTIASQQLQAVLKAALPAT